MQLFEVGDADFVYQTRDTDLVGERTQDEVKAGQFKHCPNIMLFPSVNIVNLQNDSRSKLHDGGANIYDSLSQ